MRYPSGSRGEFAKFLGRFNPARGFESHPHRQLGNEVIGPDFVEDPRWLCYRDSPRPSGARQLFFWEISSRFACPPKPRRRREFSKAKSGLFCTSSDTYETFRQNRKVMRIHNKTTGTRGIVSGWEEAVRFRDMITP